jgi:hypothetical protein
MSLHCCFWPPIVHNGCPCVVALPCKVLGKFTLHSEVCLDGDAFCALGECLEGHLLRGSVVGMLVSVMIGIGGPAGCCRHDPLCVTLSWLTQEMNISSIGGLALLRNVAILGKDAILGEVTLCGKVAFSEKSPSLANLPSAHYLSGQNQSPEQSCRALLATLPSLENSQSSAKFSS